MKLVIAEKPSVANSIAEVIGANDTTGDGYRSGNGYIVSWCVGHLIELSEPASYGEQYEKWTYDSLPIIPDSFSYEVKNDTIKQYKVLSELMMRDDVESLVCATDAGREGELIFRLVYNKVGCQKPFERLWISSMEESSIRDGFNNLKPGREFDHLYESALARQKADWLVGINGTRLFTVLYNKLLKVGRVQTPTLAMLVDREMKINDFKKETYYIAHILGNGIDAVSEHIGDKSQADSVAKECKNEQATVTSVVNIFKVSGKEVISNGWKDFDDIFKKKYKTTEEKTETDDVNKLPDLTEGMNILVEDTRVSEHYTQPPKHYTEDSLLAAMDKAGSEDMSDDVERKGLGTPATRADIIEKLVKDGFVKREKKQMIPTDDGIKLITILPDVVKSPKLTADWENELAQVSKGEVAEESFMEEITQMVGNLVATYSSVSEEDKSLFKKDQEVFGECPKCGKNVVKGKYGAYCVGKCGMGFGRALGVTLSDAQVKNLLAGKKILVKGIKSKKGSVYDAYLTPTGIAPYSYTDSKGNEKNGFQYEYDMDFPKKK